MAAVIICSNFGAQENNLSLFPLFPHLFAMKRIERVAMRLINYHMYNQIDSGKFTVWHRKLKSGALWWGGKWERGSRGRGHTYTYD